ncbi:MULTISPECIES: DUF928 domain-containing protein [Planktothricoides]|uniref:DUF928 domain-containing protein n=2 Tax=Planktothricoides raciborskii TaxID=132608 RepID=A0AAU8JBU3_9CYAN|nr:MULTISPECIES: DUF928 domain-containing protein [Planktothricoides]KOR35358.1 hypothetical protein AM228_18570 [Planktothricoides sp. SR001]MBD2545985.1 DUF928 domain-containing protein [Planktothricoides raciborskii FACHB-1370]MBD2583370.1 DUF928 domain-containing protein [Planktothricoides raciborskii FACHB-1261]
MPRNHLAANISQVAIAISIAIAGSIGISGSATAGPKLNVENRGAPTLTAGAASRSGNTATMIALQAPSQKTLTVAVAPTVFIYISNTTASEGIFVLKDENENDIARMTVALPDQPGIVRIQLPETMMSEALQVGKEYQWVFSPVSSNQSGINTTFINGWIERIELSPNQISRLNNTDPLGAVDLYAEAELWQDALATLAEFAATNPNNSNLEAKWNNLLNQAGMGNLAGVSVDFAQAVASNN